jgi:hypothetical protein
MLLISTMTYDPRKAIWWVDRRCASLWRFLGFPTLAFSVCKISADLAGSLLSLQFVIAICI